MYSFIEPLKQSRCEAKNTACRIGCLPTQSTRQCHPCKNNKGSTVRPVLCSTKLNSNIPINHRDVCNGQAWIEHAADAPSCTKCQNECWTEAKSYNEKIRQMRQEKEEKLQEFQREVKRRVRQLDEKKHHMFLKTTLQDVELERKIARRTAFLAQGTLPNASDVMVAGRNDQIMKNIPSHRQSQLDSTSNKYDVDSLKDIAKLNDTVASEKEMRKAARSNLISRRLTSEVKHDLPGGFWKDTSTVEFPAPLAYMDKEPITVEALAIAIHVDPAHPIHSTQGELAGEVNRISLSPAVDTSKPTGNKAAGGNGCVMFSQDLEEVKRQEVKQRALLRRLYMDMEREQVKEYKKMKRHMDRIAQLKKTKENKRRELERQLDAKPNDSLEHESHYIRSRCQAHLNRDTQIRKETENRRYLIALRTLLRDKLARLGVDVPPLCSCGDTIWDTHPDTCANNCPFYKNPKGYERAVQALLASCEES